MEIIRFSKIESTSTCLKKLAREGAPEGTVVIAGAQTGGRGTNGRSFSSPEGGLYLSYLMRPQTSAEDTVDITRCAAVAVYDALSEFRPGIKYINDLLLGGKKVCGILTEYCDGNLVIGVGINVNTETFPEDIKDTATSLFLHTGAKQDIEKITERLISELEKLAGAYPAARDEYISRYESLLVEVPADYPRHGGDENH